MLCSEKLVSKPRLIGADRYIFIGSRHSVNILYYLVVLTHYDCLQRHQTVLAGTLDRFAQSGPAVVVAVGAVEIYSGRGGTRHQRPAHCYRSLLPGTT